MVMAGIVPDGVFPSVVLSSGFGTLAVRQGDPRVLGWLVVYRFHVASPDVLTELARFDLPAGSPCFPNLYVLDGVTWLAYHDGQYQRLRNLLTGEVSAVAGLSNPSAFGAGCFAYTEPVQPYRVHRLDLRTGVSDQPRLGAPTGLSRILDDGRVITIDEDRHALPGATIPSFAGSLEVGEGASGGAQWTAGPYSGVLWPSLDSFTPKCAADGNVLAITAAGSGSVRLFCGTLTALLVASALIDRKPGLINTDDEKKEEHMAETLPGSVAPIIGRYVARFPVPQGAGPEDFDPVTKGASERFENTCRRWVLALAEQVRFETNDPRWGVKNAGGGRPQSKDSLTFNGPRLVNYDLLSGVGTGRPSLVAQPAGEDITGQTFLSVQPVDHLGGGAPPVDKPPVDKPSPATDLAPLLARFAALEARLAVAEQKVADLQRAEADVLDQVHQLDATTIKVGQFKGAKSGDPVIVSGSISARAIATGAKVTWTGTIQ